jgi:hypothetical protein
MLNDRGRKYMKQMIELHQSQVDEPILAATLFTTAGAMTSMGVGILSPLAGVLMRRSGKKKAGGLPFNVSVVVTPTNVHVFEVKPSRGRMVPKALRDTWVRRDIQVRTEDKPMATRVIVDFPQEGRQVQLDATKARGGMSEEVIRYLTEPTLTQHAV